ncbi:MAG: hypothetical protein ACLP0J_18050 [Solirubrobacteraceae bacterium]
MARVSVAGSSTEPVRELAEPARRLPRTTDTKDLSVSLRSNERSGGVGRVLNLCYGGMLVEGSSEGLEVAETIGFELIGPDFRYAGLAAVAHREHEAIGLRFVTTRGPVDRSVRALAAARLSRGQLGSHDPRRAPPRIPTVCDSRKYRAALISRLQDAYIPDWS